MNDDSQPPATPEESLRLIDQQRAAVAGRLQGTLAMYYIPWGVTWLVGFGMFVLRDGFGDDGGLVPMPESLPLVVLFTLLGSAIVFTVVTGFRESMRIGGESRRSGVLYGLSWGLTYGTMMPIVGRFADLLPQDERGMLFAATAVGLTGALYVAGAAIWHSESMAVLGGWLLVINLAGVLAGPQWHSFVVAVAGGGGLIVTGLGAWWHGRRVRP